MTALAEGQGTVLVDNIVLVQSVDTLASSLGSVAVWFEHRMHNQTVVLVKP